MAERRMFAKTIIDSDVFIDMPISTRLLYYDLAMRADDDGFVNSPKKIMKFVGASTDDMNILIARQFVIPFESGVVVIRHWKIHNYIRKDRYQETVCKEEKRLLSIDENNSYELKNNTPLTIGQPNDNQRLTQDKISKDKLELSKESIVEEKSDDKCTMCAQCDGETETDIKKNTEINIKLEGKKEIDNFSPQAEVVSVNCPYAKIRDLYHKICISYPKIKTIDGNRKTAVGARWRTYKSLEVFEELFTIAESTPFLKGENDRNWSADFDWMMKPTNFSKILEHKYDDRSPGETKLTGALGILAKMYDEAKEREADENDRNGNA